MAGNFWLSSHCQQWLLEKQDVIRGRGIDLQKISEEEYQKLMIFFANYIQAIAEGYPGSNIRQQVIATATVYFKRFYSMRCLRSIDPFLMAPTCIFLASKVEECGMLSTSKLLGVVHNLPSIMRPISVKSGFSYTQQFSHNQSKLWESAHIFEAEFFLLEILDCCLIVYHPYRPLMQFIHDLPKEKEGKDDSLLSLAWKICNDSLRTDACLNYPPFQIALACLHIAVVMLGREKEFKTWFAELAVDLEKVFEVVHQILSQYRLWKSFDPKEQVHPILQKIGKPNHS